MRSARAVVGLVALGGIVAVGAGTANGQVGGPQFRPVVTTGSIVSGPDAAGGVGPGDGRWIVARGTDNALYVTPIPSDANTWTPIGAPPGGAQGDPTIVSWAPGRLDVFARGADNKLWSTFRASANAAWSAWTQPVGVDGTLASGPEASSRGPGRIDVFVVGTDGQAYQRLFENGSWNGFWIPRGDPPGAVGIQGEVTSVSRDGTIVDLFVRGTDDNLWQQHWNGSMWDAQWFLPVGDAGTLTSSPDVGSYAPYNLAVFVRGTDGGVWWADFRSTNDPAWTGWFRVGRPSDVIVDGPGVTADILFVTVVGRGTDNLPYFFSTGLDGEPPQP